MSKVECEVVPGPGTVARRGDSLAWASDGTSDVLWETLLSCLALGGRTRGAGPLLHAFAEAMPAELAADAAFAVVVTDGTAGFVLRHGHVEVTVDGEPLTGGSLVPVTVVGRMIAAGDPDGVRALGGRTAPTRHDLRDGSVAGSAFRWSAGTAAPAAMPTDVPLTAAPPEPEPEPFRPLQLGPVTDAHAEATSDPEETAFHPPPMTDSTASPAVARNAGVLVFEDGATATLTGDVVLGRRPDKHQLVETGQAQPLVIQDPEHVLSSAHAAVRIDGGNVVVIDLDSLNGTHIAAPDARDWTKLTAGAPYPLHDGYRMLLGWTVLTYRAAS